MASSPPSSPISVLRKSGSSNCLQPRSDSGELPSSPSSTNLFTVVHTEELANYSAERYYILSELQLKAHSISFLSEWDAGENYHNYNPDPATDESHTTQEMSCSSWGGDASINITKEESIRYGDCDVKDCDKSSNSKNSDISNEMNNDDGGEQDNIAQGDQQRRQRHDSNLNLPPGVVLYLLWRYDSPHADSPELFAKHYIRPCVQRILDAYKCNGNSIETANNIETPQQPLLPSSIGGEDESGDDGEKGKILMQDNNQYYNTLRQELKPIPHIYIVIDRICTGPPIPVQSPGDDHHRNEDHNAYQLALTKKLMQIVATSQTLQLRSVIEGITVGVSSNVRAAPGLEQCMNAIMVGDAERRLMLERNGMSRGAATASTKFFTGEKWNMEDPQCSCIAIIADHPDDLVGLDPTMEADAVQGMDLHLRMYTEWCGGGNILNFATRAQKVWRTCFLKGQGDGITTTNDVPFSEMDQIFTKRNSTMSRGRRRQQRLKAKSLSAKDKKKAGDDMSNIMIAIFLAFVFLQIKKEYGEEITSVLFIIYEMFKDVTSYIYEFFQGTKDGVDL